MPQYIEVAQTLPFDGVIFEVATPEDSRGLGWTLFGSTSVDKTLLKNAADQIAQIQWGRLTDNFLRINIYPADVDWFDDFDTLLDNLETAARFAHDIGFMGIMLDTEQYPGVNLFNYQQQKYRNKYRLKAYDAQAYLHGQQVMQAINRGFPGVTVLYTFGLTIGSQPQAPRDLAAHPYGLLMPFIEGMISAADDQTTLVDAFEGAYTYRDELQFLYAYKLIRGFTRDFYARNPQQYGRVVRAGFGLWLDHNDCDELGLQPTGCPPGFTPQTFEQAIQLALRYTDRYVWVYSEGLSWYTGEGIPENWKPALQSFFRS
ncbi:MAG TPA: hypothetical protein VHO69_01230 [Phototrophicaceae bacterium]|nr:hypothetical protein [Phototrophicaceae bacterium]